MFASVDAGSLRTCGVTTSGQPYCWGNGPVGDGFNVQRRAPTLVTGGLTFASVSAAVSYSCGSTTNGNVYCWGINAFGNLGDGTSTTRLVPTLVTFP
jgi:alpha-tubulin suppressor-like RCC1 family protein